MSPHILIDQALEALAHPASEPGAEAVVQRMIINMLKGNVITIEEFNHYCARLNRVSRKEAA